MTSSPRPFDDIRALLKTMPGPDANAVAAVKERDAQLTKPAGSLGRLEEIVEWLAAWQGAPPPHLDSPLVAVFAGNHGVVAQGVSPFPQSVTKAMVANFANGGAAINQICKTYNLGLKVYELALEMPTGDITREPALDEKACAGTMAFGMEALASGPDLLCLGEMGIGNTTIAAAIYHALWGGAAEDWVGRGTGVGAILGARIQRVPVLLDGFVVCAAAAILHAIDPGAIDHCLAAHVSAENAHAAALRKLGKTPLLNLGMRLGEGSGAALAAGVVRAALACHQGMATFAEAGVAGKEA
jgi:nicotinate-nucleotide--dimethylbenzimidazole phosphoribosyltransferase